MVDKNNCSKKGIIDKEEDCSSFEEKEKIITKEFNEVISGLSILL